MNTPEPTPATDPMADEVQQRGPFRPQPQHQIGDLAYVPPVLLRLGALLAAEGYIGYDLPSPPPSSSHSYRLADDDAPAGGPGPGPGAEG